MGPAGSPSNLGEDGSDVEDREALRVGPSDADLERAIASVTGVTSAAVDRSSTTGRSRLRIRLMAGADPEKVSWAVAATLRERFDIALDPADIRPRGDDLGEVEADQPRGPSSSEGDTIELTETRDRLTMAAREALADLGPGPRRDRDDTHEPDPGPRVEDVTVRAVHDGDGGAAPRPTEPEPRSHVGPPWPVGGDRSSRWLRRSEPPPTPGPPASRATTDRPQPTQDVSAVRSGPSTPSNVPAEVDTPTAALGATTFDTPAEVGRRPTAAGTATATRPVRSARAAIRHLDTRRDERLVRVTATLEQDGRSARGEATTAPTTHGVFRAVAEATVAALAVLIGPALVAGIDRVSVQPTGEPANAMVAVSLVTARGEETLLGTSLVRGDPEHAVMRATLDALNRRVGELALLGGPSDAA